MDKAHDSSLARSLHRRLASVKLAIRMLHHEMDLGGEGARTSIDRGTLESVASTLELFVEDVESEIGAPKPPALTNGDRRATLVPEKPVPRLS